VAGSSRRAGSVLVGLLITLAISTTAATQRSGAAWNSEVADQTAVKGVVSGFMEALNDADMELKLEGLRIQLYDGSAVVTFPLTGKTMFSRRALVLHREGGERLIVHMRGSGLPIQEQRWQPSLTATAWWTPAASSGRILVDGNDAADGI
jgi:hypothetical protein